MIANVLADEHVKYIPVEYQHDSEHFLGDERSSTDQSQSPRLVVDHLPRTDNSSLFPRLSLLRYQRLTVRTLYHQRCDNVRDRSVRFLLDCPVD